MVSTRFIKLSVEFENIKLQIHSGCHQGESSSSRCFTQHYQKQTIPTQIFVATQSAVHSCIIALCNIAKNRENLQQFVFVTVCHSTNMSHKFHLHLMDNIHVTSHFPRHMTYRSMTNPGFFPPAG